MLTILQILQHSSRKGRQDVFHSPRYYLALNHLIIIGKYYLYVNASARNIQIDEFIHVSLVHDKLLLEKYITIKSGKQDRSVKNGISHKVLSSLV